MKPTKPTRSAFPDGQYQELRATQQAPRDIAVLVPVVEPSEHLIDLVDLLTDAGVAAILVVDDGSAVESQPLFELLAQNNRVHLLRHEQNEGKGSALKTGIAYFLAHLAHYKGLVTADGDGQHAADDVVRMARALYRAPRLAIVGARNFDLPLYPGMPAELPPLRSLVGNRFSSAVFRWITGVPLTDAQSGLRALPSSLLPLLLALPGTRYEWEMSMLLLIARMGHPLAEQPIRTLYPEGNGRSHFRPVRDSLRVLAALLDRRVQPGMPVVREQRTPSASLLVSEADAAQRSEARTK